MNFSGDGSVDAGKAEVGVEAHAFEAHLLDQARRCRRLARGVDDRATKDRLLSLANDYERRAAAMEAGA